MKIVVVGLGKVGRALTQQLSADKHDIVVIDRNPTVVDDICNICDVRGVTGNGGCYEVQAEAFEGGADLLIAATDSDPGLPGCQKAEHPPYHCAHPQPGI